MTTEELWEYERQVRDARRKRNPKRPTWLDIIHDDQLARAFGKLNGWIPLFGKLRVKP